MRWFRRRRCVFDEVWAESERINAQILGSASVDSGCPVRMRAPGAISCFWSCDLPPGHDGEHQWSHGGEVVAQFSTEDASSSWSHRPSIVEMDAWAQRSRAVRKPD